LGENFVVHFVKVASTIGPMTYVEEVSSLNLQSLERFLPIFREAILRKPQQHSIKWPLKSSLAG
jgi:hypothetical protein